MLGGSVLPKLAMMGAVMLTLCRRPNNWAVHAEVREAGLSRA